MKKFQFKLQAVLTLRQRVEQAALETYSRSLLARQSAMTRLADLEKELARTWTDLREQLVEGCISGPLQKVQDYCRFLNEKKVQAEQFLGQAEIELNQALQKMLVARQEREAVEQYFSSERDRHDRELLVEERKIIEDLVNRRSPKPLLWKPGPDIAWN